MNRVGKVTRNVLLLAVLVGVEAMIVLAFAVVSIVSLLGGAEHSAASAIALIVLIAIVGVLGVALAVSTARGSRRVRGAIFTWQVLQVAAALVIVQGDMFAWLGWLLLALSVASIAILFQPSTQRELTPRAESGSEG